MSKFNHTTFQQMPIVGIMRNYSNEAIEKIIPLYLKAGLSTLEITMNSSNAEEMIKFISQNFPEINIGAGTVCEQSELFKALDAGASFIVTPVLSEEVIKFCVTNQVPVFPGAFTPSEIYKAWKMGATAVKIFPALMFGPAYIKEIKAPLNDVKLMPTGGVTLHNIQEFFGNGASAVGMGGTLFDKQMVADENWNGLYHHFLNFTEKVKAIIE